MTHETHAHATPPPTRDKHDQDCRRRKHEWDFPYLCTCALTDQEGHNNLHRGHPEQAPPPTHRAPRT